MTIEPGGRQLSRRHFRARGDDRHRGVPALFPVSGPMPALSLGACRLVHTVFRSARVRHSARRAQTCALGSNLGARFSLSEASPSRMSGPVKPRNRERGVVEGRAEHAEPVVERGLVQRSRSASRRPAAWRPEARSTACPRLPRVTPARSVPPPRRRPARTAEGDTWPSPCRTAAADDRRWSPAATPRRVWPSMIRAVLPRSRRPPGCRRPAPRRPRGRASPRPGLGAVEDVVDHLARLAPDAACASRSPWPSPRPARGRRRPRRLAGAADHRHRDLRIGVDVAPDIGQLRVHLGVGRVQPARACRARSRRIRSAGRSNFNLVYFA